MSDPLEILERALRGCAAAVMPAAAQGVARAVMRRLLAGFRTSRDIHGKPYIPPKDGHRPPMIRSGRLRDSYVYWYNRRGRDIVVTFRNQVAYAEYLRDGTPKMAPRQHIPQPNEAPPPDMDAAIHAECGGAMAGYWRRVRL